MAHGDYTIAVRARVLIKKIRQEIELLFNSPPSLLSFRMDRKIARRCSAEEMTLTALRQTLVTKRYHDGKQRLHEYLLDIVHEQRLQCTRSLGKYLTCCKSSGCIDCRREGIRTWVGDLQVLSNVIRIGKNYRCLRRPDRIHNDWEREDRSSVVFNRCWWSPNTTERCLDVWKFYPSSAVGEPFVIEYQSGIYQRTQMLQRNALPYAPDIWGPWLWDIGWHVVQYDHWLRHRMSVWVVLITSRRPCCNLLRDESTGTLSFDVRDFTAAVDFDTLYV
jgi:hypothetical protein